MQTGEKNRWIVAPSGRPGAILGGAGATGGARPVPWSSSPITQNPITGPPKHLLGGPKRKYPKMDGYNRKS